MKQKLPRVAFRRALAAAGAATLAAAAQAQDQPQRLEEITVTARKIEENLQDTPTAVTAMTGNSSLTTGSGYAEIAYARPQQWFVTLEYDF